MCGKANRRAATDPTHVVWHAVLAIGLSILPLAFGCAKQVTGGAASQQEIKQPTPAAVPSAPTPSETPKIGHVSPAPQAPPSDAPRTEIAPLPPPPAPVEVHKPDLIPSPPVSVPEERVTEVVPTPSAPLPPTAAVMPAPSVMATTLSDIYFDYDQSALRADARAALEHNANALKNGIAGAFVIEGHCDERGTHAYNLVLGERRAQAVRRYLEDLGVAGHRITIASYGKERPFCTEHSEACWQENRRAHFSPR